MATETPITHLRREHEKFDHPAVGMLNTEKEELLTDNMHENVELHCTEHLSSLNDHDYLEKIKEFNVRLDMVKDIARPGCSNEVLNTTLSFMSSLAAILSKMPLKQKIHASL